MDGNPDGKGTEVRTPADMAMALAKEEIGSLAIRCMRVNGIPPGLMAYVLKEVLLDITRMQAARMAEEFTRLQQAALGMGTGNGGMNGADPES